MKDFGDQIQRIGRLTGLAEVAGRINELVVPVAPRPVAIAAAFGRTPTDAVTATETRPAAPLAIRDGFALAADATLDAGGYAPAPLAAPPPTLDVGEPLPADTDAIAPPDAVDVGGSVARALAPVAPGDGVLPCGGDVAAGESLRHAGERLRRTDLAILAILGANEVRIREPRVRVVPARTGDVVLDAIVALIADAIAAKGGVASAGLPDGQDLEHVLAGRDADAVIVVGGSGSGRRDHSIHMLARLGRVVVHGIALSPGETAAFGVVGKRPVLVVPGRLDAALAVWLMLGRQMLARLAGRAEDARHISTVLHQKVSSTLGLVELVPARRQGDSVVPLGSGYLSLHTLAQADGLIVVPADSEGFPAGARVEMRLLP